MCLITQGLVNLLEETPPGCYGKISGGTSCHTSGLGFFERVENTENAGMHAKVTYEMSSDRMKLPLPRLLNQSLLSGAVAWVKSRITNQK
jgi:hypothetical protein